MSTEVQDTEKAADASLTVEQGEQAEQVELMKVSMNGEVFVMPVSDVSAVVRPVDVTPVPMAPDHMLGVVNVRGQIVCMVDPGKALHLQKKRNERTPQTRYLILRHARMHLGIWVDDVAEIYRVAKASLPKNDDEHTGYVRGEINLEGETFKLLNTQVLFA